MTDNRITLFGSVRDYECDMQGIVNNAVYLNYMEHARHEFLKSKGYTFKDLTDKGFILTVSSTEIKYLRSLVSGDSYRIETTVLREKAHLVFLQDIYKHDGDTLSSKASTKVVCSVGGRVSRGTIFDDILKS